MTYLRRLLPVVLISMFVVCGGCFAQNYSADMVTVGAMSPPSKIFVKGNKIRTEMTIRSYPGGKPGPNMKITTIVRGDKKVTWMLNSQSKTYMETPASNMPANQTPEAIIKTFGSRATAKKLGNETINGYQCQKTQCTLKGTKGQTITFWYSPKLKSIVKAMNAGARRSAGMELKNIKEGSVSDSVFEIPKGYKKVSPNAMSPMGGQMPPHGKGMARPSAPARH